jgi:membrane protease YdiL (CAAX protease family)
LFAIGFVATGSLWWLIAAHALIDLYGGLVAWSVMRVPPPAVAQSA